MPYKAQIQATLGSGAAKALTEYLAALNNYSPLALWDAGVGVYSDAGTTPAAPDALVAQLNDQSGSGYHVTAVSSPTDRRAVYRASVAALNNRPALQFDDVNDLYSRDVAGGVLAAAGNTYCAIAVFATDNDDSLDYIYSEGAVTPTIRLGKNNGAAIGVHRDDASVVVSISGGSGAGDGAMHVAGFRRLASDDFRLMLDGTQVANSTNAPGVTTVSTICIGALWQTTPDNAANHWGGYLAHVSLYPSDVYAQVRPILDAWYRPA